MIKEGFKVWIDVFGEFLEYIKWSMKIKMKAQVNAKATITLQCRFSLNQLNKVGPGPFKSANDL